METKPSSQSAIPRLSANEVEAIAEGIIRAYDPKILERPCQTPLAEIVAEIGLGLGLAVEMSRDLGKSPEGYKILGAFQFRPPTIYLDKILQGDVRFFFTLGHEFGHLMLHCDITIQKRDYSDIDFSDSERDFRTGRKILATPRDWLEWQANRFANAILMPRVTLSEALVSVQRSLGINCNVGRIFLDNNAYSARDLNSTLAGLNSIYKVGKIYLRHRLTDQGFIDDERNKNSQ